MNPKCRIMICLFRRTFFCGTINLTGFSLFGKSFAEIKRLTNYFYRVERNFVSMELVESFFFILLHRNKLSSSKSYIYFSNKKPKNSFFLFCDGRYIFWLRINSSKWIDACCFGRVEIFYKTTSFRCGERFLFRMVACVVFVSICIQVSKSLQIESELTCNVVFFFGENGLKHTEFWWGFMKTRNGKAFSFSPFVSVIHSLSHSFRSVFDSETETI